MAWASWRVTSLAHSASLPMGVLTTGLSGKVVVNTIW